ncbi:Fibroblast growth factor receptor 4 [Holothuria leucospilota]|uniref:Fibroblast growth factor receptor 4 n=1 Tax=Holothuria leucospilota TaxID=206669 RepID=A0A9Q1H6Z2_HOLLE|nr:Fibroblast growth factor receptor 4 [Holothuria leucospilota]
MNFKFFSIFLCAITSNLGVSSFASSNFCPETIPSSSYEVSCSKEPIGKTCLVCPTNKTNNMWWYRNSETISRNGVLTGIGPFKRNSCHPTLESLEVSGIISGEDVYECAGNLKKTIRKFILNLKDQTTLYIREIPSVSIGNDTTNGSLSEIIFECVLEGAYGNVSLSWYVDDQLELKETFHDRSEYKDHNVSYTLLLKYHNTSKTENVSCRSSGPFIKDKNVSLTINPGSCSSKQCITNKRGTFWSNPKVVISVIAVASACVSVGCLLCLLKRKNSRHAGHLQINPRKSNNRARETYRAASILIPSTSETVYTNQKVPEELNEPNFEVSLEVQVKTTSEYEYWKGTVTTQGQQRRSCFIKTLAAKSTLEKAFVFKKLAEKLLKLQIHENIVDVLSISTMDVPYSICFEYVECGNLREFIMTRYQHAGVSQICEYSMVVKASVVKRQTQELLSFTRDIAEGMSFLESQKFCHPALCLRKVLLTGQVRCKLYDIHPLKMAMQRINEVMEKEHPPTAWLAPETLFIKEYTAASDAWNFAVVLWEIFSLGVTFLMQA